MTSPDPKPDENRHQMTKKSLSMLLAALLLLGAAAEAAKKDRKKKRKQDKEDPYAEYVWPPPPSDPRIKLEAVIRGRIDVEAKSRWSRALLGASPQALYDHFERPFAVDFDSQGRVLLTDTGHSALIRIDEAERRFDVLGTQGSVRLSVPLGIHVGPDDTIYVADAGLHQVVALTPEGGIAAVYGGGGQLKNPTDVVLSPDGKRLYVADSKGDIVVAYDVGSGNLIKTIGSSGAGEGAFRFPTSLAFGPEGYLYVVDQLNSRVQVFDADDEYYDTFGSLGVGFAQFVRPKDVAVDEVGFIYVTDNAFNNVQLFDADFTLLTFIGSGGDGPGRFNGASGVAVQGDRIAVVDQLGKRLQLFRFLVSKES
jgi:DNA-binding beta-propeller fold protein YncE